MSEIITKVAGGARRNIRQIRRYNGSSWDDVDAVYYNDGGVRKRLYQAIILENTGDENVLNMFTAAGSPSVAVTCILYNRAGGVIYSTNTANAALDTGTGWAAGSHLILVNEGEIYGMGGAPKDGGEATCGVSAGNGVNGAAGGDAINMQYDLRIFNNGGTIGGGGGSGGSGGGGTATFVGGTFTYGGGASGGGARYIAGSTGSGGTATCGVGTKADGGDGTAPTKTTGGIGGQSNQASGGAGGVAGNNGLNGTTYTCGSSVHGGGGGGGGGFGGNGGNGGAGVACSPLSSVLGTGSTGGSAGKAVEPNGNSLDIEVTGTIYGATS